MWLCDIHMKPLLRSTVLMGLSPVAGSWPSSAALDATGSHRSTSSLSLHAALQLSHVQDGAVRQRELLQTMHSGLDSCLRHSRSSGCLSALQAAGGEVSTLVLMVASQVGSLL